MSYFQCLQDDDYTSENPEMTKAKKVSMAISPPRLSVEPNEPSTNNNDDKDHGSGEEEEDAEKATVFFWQGREATDLAWLTFNFSLRKSMEERLSRNPRGGKAIKVEFKRVRQQQEDMYFLAHFMRHMVIHNGRYQDRESAKRREAVQMYHLRANGNPIATRCIEVGCTASWRGL